jgi:alpha-ribazole phosphatase
MSSLLLIRHAETDMSGRFCGHSDPPVNQAGRGQIEALLSRLQEKKIAAVYSSDLARAVTTAAALAAFFSVSCILRPALREIHFGSWEGLSWQEIEARSPTEAAQWLADYPHRAAPQGEMVADFERRALTEIGSIFDCNPRRSVAVVTHAGVMRAALHSLCGIDSAAAWRLTEAPCSVYRYAPGLQEVRA